MENQLRGIGEVARRSGLSVSALRWYDENKVLVPAVVDPLSGYRWYAPDQIRSARIVARLRRVGLPVAAMRQVLTDPAAAPALLDAHLVRLEQGLADARRELSAALTLLTEETPMETPAGAAATLLTTTSAALAAALRAVRFAAGTDPAQPALAGVLLDIGAEGRAATPPSPPPTGTGSPSRPSRAPGSRGPRSPRCCPPAGSTRSWTGSTRPPPAARPSSR